MTPMELKATGVEMKVLAGLVLLLILSVTSLASSKTRKETFVSRNKNRTYYLFAPESLKKSEPAPLIILLHGSGRDGASLVDKWKDVASKETIILAGLNSADSSVWSTTKDGPEVVRDLVEHVKSNYPVDPRRMYLFGHSGGAVYAILLSLMQSEYFAGAAVHAGIHCVNAKNSSFSSARGAIFRWQCGWARRILFSRWHLCERLRMRLWRAGRPLK